ncbi:MAG: CorA family divalent cation transporter [Bacteriovoracaceae bacterium]|nr:magnesium transporter CorA [Bacteroidota bacterium]
MITRYHNTGKKKFDWIDVINPTTEELKSAAEKYSLHNNSVQDCLQPEHLPKFERIDETIFIIARVYDHLSFHDADTIQDISNKVAIFVGANYILTIHRGEQPFLEAIRHKYFETGQCPSPNDLLIKILYYIFQSYVSPSLTLETELDQLETQIVLKNQTHSVLRKLYQLKRKTAVCLRILRLTKTIIDNLDKNTPAAVHQDMREFYLSLETSYDQTIENANNLLNLYISLSSQRTNEVVRVLTLFSVFFMPLTFIVGIYGMNFDFMPELRHPFGYPIVLLLMASITFGIYRWFKRKRWL